MVSHTKWYYRQDLCMEREIQRSWFTLKLFLYTTKGVFLRLYKDAKSGEKKKKKEKNKQRKNGGLIS